MTKISKEKQASTLKKMKENRKEDSRILRNIFEQKLEWAKKEKQKAIIQMKQLEVAKITLQKEIYRLDGAIIAIDDILHPQENPDNSKDTNTSE